MYSNNNTSNNNESASNEDFIHTRNRSNTWPLQPVHAELPAFNSMEYSTNETPFYSQTSLYSEFNGSLDSGTASSSFSNVYYNTNSANLPPSINTFNKNTLLRQNFNFFKQNNQSPANSPPNSPMSFSFPSTSIDSGATQQLNFFALSEMPSSSSHNSHSSLTEFNKTLNTIENVGVEIDDLTKKKRCRGKTEEVPKRKTNPWGEESYSELIEKALNSARDKKLKLNQIYDWFVNNLEYFRNRSNNEEGYGWKV